MYKFFLVSLMSVSLLAQSVSSIPAATGGGGGGSGTATAIQTSTVAGLPATCAVGDIRYVTDATVNAGGSQIYKCTSTNTWTQETVTSDDNSILFTSSALGNPNLRVNPAVISGGVTITGGINYVPYQFPRNGSFNGVASTGYCVLVPVWATTTFSQASFITDATASSTQSVAIYSNTGTLLTSGNATSVSGVGAQIPLTPAAISGSVYVCHTANVVVSYQVGDTWDLAAIYNGKTKINFTANTAPTLSGTYTWPSSNTFTAIAGTNGGRPMYVSLQN